LIVSLLTNMLVAVEVRVASLTQMVTVSASGNNSSGGGPSSSNSSAAPLLNASGAVFGRNSSIGAVGGKTAQQQQHLKNYQSITMEELP
jgi:hypothetical protein